VLIRVNAERYEVTHKKYVIKFHNFITSSNLTNFHDFADTLSSTFAISGH